jgi:hypothetical protein
MDGAVLVKTDFLNKQSVIICDLFRGDCRQQLVAKLIPVVDASTKLKMLTSITKMTNLILGKAL